MIAREFPDTVEVFAPAKLNLFLEVLGRRDDGYHDIESLMVTVDEPRDVLTLADSPSGRLSLRCSDPDLSAGPENLVLRAAEALRAESGRPLGASIALGKSIPMGAGLAGGSSDAAATLSGLDRLWNLGTSPDRLDALAASIGSDVTFFRHAPAAVCRGRGERVERVALTSTLWFVLVCPPMAVSTAEVYGRLAVPDRPVPIGPTLDAFATGDPRAIGAVLFNRLQPIAEALCPALTRVRDALRACPTLVGSQMSGSGSAYFGLADSRGAAEEAAARLASATPGPGKVRVVPCRP